jgi:hypothetical protein
MALACDRDQAGIVFDYIKGYFETVPALKKMVVDVSSETIELNNHVVIEVRTNSYRKVRGRSVLCCIMDEVAFFASDDSANPDFEVYGAIRPGLARVPGSMLVLISTAHKRSGLLYERYKAHFGRSDGDVLVVKGTTLQFNPLFDAAEIEKALGEDPALYGAEYNSLWRDDVSSFIGRDLVEAATDRGATVRQPVPGTRYVTFVDPSGGGPDSFTAAVAHREGDVAVLDCLIEVRGPCNPDVATADICKVFKSYGITKTTGDNYAKGWPVAAFAKHGIALTRSERNRSEIYLDALPMFASGRVRLVDNPRLAQQFWSLERRTFPSGQDKVDHGRGGHDDCANAAAGALVLAASKKPMPRVSQAFLARAAQPTAYSRERLTDQPLMGTRAQPGRIKCFF